eukprot:6462209-Amphidinium_carterae.1
MVGGFALIGPEAERPLTPKSKTNQGGPKNGTPQMLDMKGLLKLIKCSVLRTPRAPPKQKYPTNR